MKRWLMLSLMALCTAVSAASELGYTVRDTELKEKPFLDAATVSTLPSKTAVEVLTRRGGWMEVRSSDGKQRGWARLLNVRLGDPERRPPSGNLLSALGIGNRPRPQTTATVTTGVRGFSEEDLQKAEPAPEELKRMEGYAADAPALARFAREGNLKPGGPAHVAAEGRPLETPK